MSMASTAETTREEERARIAAQPNVACDFGARGELPAQPAQSVHLYPNSDVSLK